MKAKIHPKYTEEITVTCACGNFFKTGSTMGDISVEICAVCHPFWTGLDKVLDTGGRVDRFAKRSAKTATKSTAKATK